MKKRTLKQILAATLLFSMLATMLSGCVTLPFYKEKEEMKCPDCSEGVSEDAAFCSACGKQLTSPKCSVCEAELVENAAFCSACGTAVGESEVEPEPEVNPEPQPKPEVKPEQQPQAQNVNLLANCSKEDRYRINVFLSNFAEQNWIHDYPFFGNVEYEMLQFLFIYSAINAPKTMTAEGDCDVITKSRADEVLNRFFGETIQPVNGARYSTPESGPYEYFEYKNGKYYRPMAYGESYPRFVIADWMQKNDDGTYEVNFLVYEVDLEYYFEYGVPKEFYYLSPEQAQTKSMLTCVADGTAFVTDYQYGNKTTYQLYSYQSYG